MRPLIVSYALLWLSVLTACGCTVDCAWCQCHITLLECMWVLPPCCKELARIYGTYFTYWNFARERHYPIPQWDLGGSPPNTTYPRSMILPPMVLNLPSCFWTVQAVDGGTVKVVLVATITVSFFQIKFIFTWMREDSSPHPTKCKFTATTGSYVDEWSLLQQCITQMVIRLSTFFYMYICRSTECRSNKHAEQCWSNSYINSSGGLHRPAGYSWTHYASSIPEETRCWTGVYKVFQIKHIITDCCFAELLHFISCSRTDYLQSFIQMTNYFFYFYYFSICYC